MCWCVCMMYWLHVRELQRRRLGDVYCITSRRTRPSTVSGTSLPTHSSLFAGRCRRYDVNLMLWKLIKTLDNITCIFYQYIYCMGINSYCTCVYVIDVNYLLSFPRILWKMNQFIVVMHDKTLLLFFYNFLSEVGNTPSNIGSRL